MIPVTLIRTYEAIPLPIRYLDQVARQGGNSTWHKAVRQWSAESLGGNYKLHCVGPMINADFEDVEDAVLFRLRWA